MSEERSTDWQWLAVLPFPAIFGLEEKRQIRYISPTSEEISKLRVTFPELIDTEIPPGTYPSLLARYQTVGFYNFAVADKDLPGDLVYDIADAVFTHHRELVDTDPPRSGNRPREHGPKYLPSLPRGSVALLQQACWRGHARTGTRFPSALHRNSQPLTNFAGHRRHRTVVVGAAVAACLLDSAHFRSAGSASLAAHAVGPTTAFAGDKVVLITAAVFASFNMMGRACGVHR